MKIYELRKEKKLNQEQTAIELGIQRATYANYETEKTQPTIEILCRIADYYGVSLDYLCDHKTNQLDTSFYEPIAKEIIKKLPLLNNSNLLKLNSVCDGLILGQ